MAFPYPNGTDVVEIISYPGVVLDQAAPIDGLWGIIILMTFWIISTVSIYEFRRVTRIEEALAASSFTASIMAVFLAGLGLLTSYVVFFPMVVTGIAGALLYIGK